jgi:hypothetical protein
MARLVLIPLLMIVGCVLAGLYGVLHDQLSYTVSPEYFTAFKFRQFEVAPALQNRVGVAVIGWLATWWMGVIMSAPLITGALLFRDARSGARQCLIAYAVAGLTAMLFGLGGLAAGYALFSETSLPTFAFPADVVDRVAFARVGLMHNSSYLGGVVGIGTGLIYLAISQWRFLRRGQAL